MFKNRFMPLFDVDDSVSGGIAPTSAESKETVAEVTTEPTSPSREIEIEYLGNKEKISLDDVDTIKSLLQKGKNYDRINEKWETSKTTLSKAEEIARIYGYKDENGQGTVDEFLENVRSNFDKQQVQSLVEQGYTENDAEELITLRKEREELLKIKSESEKQAQKNKAELEFLDYFKLVNGRPFTDSDQLPKEVLLEEKNGTPLKWAYADYIAKNSVKKAEIDKVNAENKETSAPSMASTAPDKMSFTKEEVDNMSRDDVKKNWDIITKSMKKWTK